MNGWAKLSGFGLVWALLVAATMAAISAGSVARIGVPGDYVIERAFVEK
jgi:hypothetical protein